MVLGLSVVCAALFLQFTAAPSQSTAAIQEPQLAQQPQIVNIALPQYDEPGATALQPATIATEVPAVAVSAAADDSAETTDPGAKTLPSTFESGSLRNLPPSTNRCQTPWHQGRR